MVHCFEVVFGKEMDVQPRHTDCISIYFHVNKKKDEIKFAFTITLYRDLDVEAVRERLSLPLGGAPYQVPRIRFYLKSIYMNLR